MKLTDTNPIRNKETKSMKDYKGKDLRPEFKELYARDKKLIVGQLIEMGCTEIMMSMQFNYYYGYFTAPNASRFYFNISDVRFWRSYENRIMYRAVHDYYDGVGGANLYVDKHMLATMNLSASPDEGRYPKVIQADWNGGGTAVSSDKP